jgi:integrase
MFLGSRRPLLPLAPFNLITLFDRSDQRAGVTHTHAHRFRYTFATWAIENQARELDVHYLLGHSTAAMVRRYAATYDSANAVIAHASFSPVTQLFGEQDAQASCSPTRPGGREDSFALVTM